MTIRITRRAILGSLPAALVAGVNPPIRKGKPLPQVGEFTRFSDPTTEATVVRLTDPLSNSWISGQNSRFVSSKERFLLFSSDRSGKSCPYRLDLRTGAVIQLAETEDLRHDSLTFDERSRFLYFLDGDRLTELNPASRKTRVLGEEITEFSVGIGPESAVGIKKRQLQLLDTRTVLAEDVIGMCAVRPGGKGCFFSRDTADGQEFWYVPFPAFSDTKQVLLARGLVLNPVWSPDGRSLLYLKKVAKDEATVAEIHESIPESGVEQRIEATSQFASFAPNNDSTVFIGASGSHAQPNVILLLRSVQRELTLCEHRASQAGGVCPTFSPDSRRVYFQSDHGGKSAVYSVNVEQLVEPT